MNEAGGATHPCPCPDAEVAMHCGDRKGAEGILEAELMSRRGQLESPSNGSVSNSSSDTAATETERAPLLRANSVKTGMMGKARPLLPLRVGGYFLLINWSKEGSRLCVGGSGNGNEKGKSILSNPLALGDGGCSFSPVLVGVCWTCEQPPVISCRCWRGLLLSTWRRSSLTKPRQRC